MGLVDDCLEQFASMCRWHVGNTGSAALQASTQLHLLGNELCKNVSVCVVHTGGYLYSCVEERGGSCEITPNNNAIDPNPNLLTCSVMALLIRECMPFV